MSNLEDFISGNRKEFDDQVPPEKLWEHIEAAVTGKKKQRSLVMPVIYPALAIAAMVTIGIFIYMKFAAKQTTAPAETKIEIAAVDSTIPDEPQVNEFAKLIVIKQEELKVLAKEQPQLYRKFTTDITQLDSSYNALKKQLNGSPNKETLIEAMIQNLQLQLNVLNQQLNIINQIKQTKKYSHEKNDHII